MMAFRYSDLGSAGHPPRSVPAPGKPTYKPVTLDIPDWMREAPWFGKQLPEPIPQTTSDSRLRRKLNERRRKERGWL